jgi:hypothetical protein
MEKYKIIKTTAKQEYDLRKKLAKLVKAGIKNPTLHDDYYEKNYKKHPELFS